jgi:hypothetical protein
MDDGLIVKSVHGRRITLRRVEFTSAKLRPGNRH